jgi:hypothetical protein
LPTGKDHHFQLSNDHDEEAGEDRVHRRQTLVPALGEGRRGKNEAAKQQQKPIFPWPVGGELS